MRCDTHSTLGHPRAAVAVAVVVAVVLAVAIVVVDRDQELRISKQVKNTQLLVSWDGIMLANLRVGVPRVPMVCSFVSRSTSFKSRSWD